MRSTALWAALWLSSLAPGGVAYQPVGPRARRPAALRAREAANLAPRWGGNETDPGSAAGNDSLRYHTDKTDPYRVTSLPQVDFNFGEMYAGLVPIENKGASGSNGSGKDKRNNSGNGQDNSDKHNANDSALFFIFKPKDGDPVDELTIWLNGGPGCSSMEGFLQENGPISWQPGTVWPGPNTYAFNSLTNMLWVDQPVGTGFSTGTSQAMGEDDVAANFLEFIKNFQELFGISNYKIYLTGESYAGKYLSYIGAAMVDANDTEHFDISGALIYDPTIGEYETIQSQAPAYPHIVENIHLWGFNQSFMDTLKGLHEQCGYESYLEQYLTYPPSGQQPPLFFDYEKNASCDIFSLAYTEVFNINPCFNPYEIRQGCPIPVDVLGMPGAFTYTPPGWFVYFDRADVKSALHASDKQWEGCTSVPVFLGGDGKGGPQSNGDLSPDPIQGALPKLIEKTNRVLIANGDFDYVIITNGTLLAIQNMTWNGDLGFKEQPSQPFIVDTPDTQYTDAFQASGLTGLNGPQGTMGVQHYERGLMWVETYMAGHMVPQYQPRAALKQLAWVLGRSEDL